MRIELLLALGVLAILSPCEARDESQLIHRYSPQDELYAKAITEAKRENPEYFRIIEKEGLAGELEGFQVLGKEAGWVSIVNTSAIAVHIDLPIYCFEKSTGRLTHAI